MITDALLTKVVEGFYFGARRVNHVKEFKEDLKFFEWNLKFNEELLPFLKSPFVSLNDKYDFIDKNFSSLMISEVITYIKYLVEKNLISYYKEMREKFDHLANLDANILSGKIYTPYEISKDRISKIEAGFANKLGQKVELTQVIEESLICGIRVLINNTVYEYSINSEIENLHHKLKKEIENKEVRND